jgi:hypothetical protein
MTLTVEQQRAIALAKARRRRTEAQAPKALTEEQIAKQRAIDDAALVDMNDPGAFRSAVAGMTQGATFGFGDEAAAALAALSPNMTYDQALKIARAELDNARAARPVLTYGAEIASGALTGGVAGKAAVGTGSTVAGMAGRGAATGAVEGAAYGFGAGRDGFTDRAKNAVQGAAVGAGVGAATPAIIAGVRAGAQGLANPIQSALNIASPAKASRAIEKALSRSGMTPQQVDDALKAAAREGQPEYMLADALGNPGQRMLSGVARQPGDYRAEVVNSLMKRQDGQGNRLAGFVDEGLNAPVNPQNLPVPVGQMPASNIGKTGAQVKSGLIDARGKAATTAYAAARDGAGPVDVRGAIAVIDDRIGGMEGSGVRGDGIDAKLAGFKARLAAPQSALKPGETARELSDFDRVLKVKQDVQDAIGEAVRAGRNNEARELGTLVSELDAALEQGSAGYRTANDQFAKASRVIEQVDAGSAAPSPRVRAEDTVSTYGKLTVDEQAAFRSGYSDPVIARIDNAAPGVNKARPLRSDKSQMELGAMANDPALLGRRIERENTMFETGAQALGGSRTADNLADSADVDALSGPLIANVLSGRWGAAATQLGQKALNTATGNSEATRALIAKALMSSDVQAALAPAQQAAIKAGKISQVVEAIIRSGSLRMIGQ